MVKILSDDELSDMLNDDFSLTPEQQDKIISSPTKHYNRDHYRPFIYRYLSPVIKNVKKFKTYVWERF